MTRMFCWKKSVSLCPASFCTPRPNLPVTPGISWLPTFAFQCTVMKKTSFLVLVLEGLIRLHQTVQLQLFWHYWLWHRLGLLWYWMVSLRNEPRWFCHFWDCTQILHFGLLLTIFFAAKQKQIGDLKPGSLGISLAWLCQLDKFLNLLYLSFLNSK